MLMKQVFTNTLFMLCFVLTAMAQDNTMSLNGGCGTKDFDLIRDRLFENRYELEKGITAEERGATRYIPIKFHLIAKADKTGRVSEQKVLENLCQMNIDYADQGVVFYLSGGTFNYIDNDAMYNDPGKTAQLMQNKRDGKAINVFVALNATNEGGSTPLGGTTLAYYSPSRDWLVSRKDQLNASSGTLSHEFGHYFSLLHPHHGWDQENLIQKYGFASWGALPDYYKVPDKVAPDGSTPIECFNGSNCKVAGDYICDTYADYNFGFGWAGCTEFNKRIIGPCDKDTINLKKFDETLFMGYFIGCKDYVFSTEQKNLMLKDYNSSKRAYIKSAFVPTVAVINTAKLVYPFSSNNASPISISPFDAIEFTWEATPNATNYIVEIDRSSGFSTLELQRFMLPGTATKQLVKNLKANLTYYWRVYPYSDGGLCIDPTQVSKIYTTFKTTATSATKELADINSITVAPNPVSENSALTMTIFSEKNTIANVTMIDVAGKMVKNFGVQNLTIGQNDINLDLNNTTKGVYFIRLNIDGGNISRKVVVAE